MKRLHEQWASKSLRKDRLKIEKLIRILLYRDCWRTKDHVRMSYRLQPPCFSRVHCPTHGQGNVRYIYLMLICRCDLYEHQIWLYSWILRKWASATFPFCGLWPKIPASSVAFFHLLARATSVSTLSPSLSCLFMLLFHFGRKGSCWSPCIPRSGGNMHLRLVLSWNLVHMPLSQTLFGLDLQVCDFIIMFLRLCTQATRISRTFRAWHHRLNHEDCFHPLIEPQRLKVASLELVHWIRHFTISSLILYVFFRNMSYLVAAKSCFCNIYVW